MSKLEKRTIKYLYENNLVEKYCDGKNSVVELYVDDGFIRMNICVAHAKYDNERKEIVDSLGRGITPQALCDDCAWHVYLMCTLEEIDGLRKEWSNLDKVKNWCAEELEHEISRTQSRVHVLEKELMKYKVV